MSPTASSSRSSRSPKPDPKSMPNASCSRSNQPPPSPRTPARPTCGRASSPAWRSDPGCGTSFAATSSPRRTRVVRVARAASVVQPSSLGSVQSPSSASRWSSIQSESQPARSTARHASRRAGQPVGGSRTPPRTASLRRQPSVARKRNTGIAGRVGVGQDVRQVGGARPRRRPAVARRRCPCSGTARPSGGRPGSRAGRA